MNRTISDIELGILDQGTGIRLYPIEWLNQSGVDPIEEFTDQCYFLVRGEDGLDRKASIKQLKEYLGEWYDYTKTRLST